MRRFIPRAFAAAALSISSAHVAVHASPAHTTPPAPASFAVPAALSPARDREQVVTLLRSALASTGEEPRVASDLAVQSGDAVEHLASATWSYHSGAAPAASVSPRSTAQVAAVLRACTAHRISVVARAGGTSLEGQTVPRVGSTAPVVVLDVSRLNRIVAVSVADLSADVEPGVGWEALGSALSPLGLVFPVDPGPGACIGGMAGTNCSGTHACRHGAFKANVLGIEAVAADGTIFRAGSRARKTSAGLDLTSLLVGSEGTLAVITRATLRLVPAPAVTRVLVMPFPTARAGCAAVADAVSKGISLAAAELMDAPMCGAVVDRDGTLLPHGGVPHVLWKLAGSAAAVDADAAALRVLVAQHGAAGVREADGPAAVALWEARKTALFSAGAARADVPDARVLTTDVCVPLSALPALLERFDAHEVATRGASGVRVFAVAHAADGNAHHFLVFDPAVPLEVNRVQKLSSWLAHEAIALGGTCTGEHGVGEGKLKYLLEELGEGNARVARAIKAALDPHGVLNPGKKIPPPGSIVEES